MLSKENMLELEHAAQKLGVYWMDSGGMVRRIKNVSAEPVDIENDGMPVPIAYLETGGYIDLENVDPSDLFVLVPLFVPTEQKVE